MPNLYKLRNDARPGELGGPPLVIGSALRVPSPAYPMWGIEGERSALHELSLLTYQDEFADVSDSWMNSVIEAVTRADLGNRSQMLRDGAGRTAAFLTAQLLKEQPYVNVLDVGCGPGGSLIAYLDELEKLDPSYKERVIITAVEPSKTLAKAVATLEERGYVSGDTVHPVHARDIDMGGHIRPLSQDIVINVAGIHANADLSYSMGAIAHVLRNGGGYFVSGDWHHGRWLHPSYTYQLLDEMDAERFGWQNKGETMDEFAKLFPRANEKTDNSSMDPADAQAIREIERYWRDGWVPVRLDKIQHGDLRPPDEQIMLEGHRPVEMYVSEARPDGMFLDEQVVADGIMSANPQQVVPGTNLNMLLVLRKA